MPVVGALITLAQSPETRLAALDFMLGHPAITVGPEREKGLAIVIESQSKAEDKAVWESLKAQPGVAFCAPVFADFSDLVEEV